MMKFQYNIRVFILLCGILFNGFSYAAMYKWIDENGRTHYSQSPPNSGVEVETIEPRAKVDTDSANKEITEQSKKAKELRDKRLSKEEQKRKVEQDADIKEKNCNQVKKSYTSYQKPRITLENNDGSSRILSEEERQKGLNKAQEQIDDFCS